MHQELAIDDSIAEFSCPKCGASAFEVTGMKRQVNPDIDATSDRAPFISMKCLRCLHVFHHEVREHSPMDVPIGPFMLN